MKKFEAITAFARNVNRLCMSRTEAIYLVAIYEIQINKKYATKQDIMKYTGERSVASRLKRMGLWIEEFQIPKEKGVGYYLTEKGKHRAMSLLDLRLIVQK